MKIGTNFVDLEWLPPLRDGGSKVTKYIIKKKEDDKWTKVTTVEAFDNSCRVKDLKDDTKYYFAVFAENKIGLSEPCETKPVKPQKELRKKLFVS